MSAPDRWSRVEALYDAARKRDPEERAAFLDTACGRDAELRRDVESLLAQSPSADGFPSGPARTVTAQRITNPDAIQPTKRRIGAYELQELLGAGGMGEVYRARDTKLGRDVAIKILPRVFTSDPERLARFEREARMLAALNHPHIGAIYGVEEAGGLRALVLELVEGSTLADRLQGGPMPVAEALTLARQMADALDAAHEKGIIHRDFKPANIKVTPDGVVKVLDLGLAKAATGDGLTPDLTQSPTVTVGGTRDGVILGTAAYMSPQQARGQAVDKRADIWAFGCVLYEMLTGRSVFARETVTDTLAAIVGRDPDWTALPGSVPTKVRDLLRKCLQRESRHRLRDIGDARLEIEEALATLAAPNAAAIESLSPRSARRTLWWSVVSAVTAAAIATLIFLWTADNRTAQNGPPAFDRLVRFVSSPAHEFGPAISPDGKWVAYLSNARGPTDVWVKFIAGGDPVNLTASARIEVQVQDYIGGLEVSPDGTQIAFGAQPPGQPAQASTWVIPAPLGGVPRKALPNGYQGLRWAPDGKRMAYVKTGGSLGDALMIADADGQNEQEIAKRAGARHIHWLRWAPDGRFVYFNYGFQNFNTEPTEIFRAPASGGPIEPVVRSARRAAFALPSPEGRGLFYAANPDSVDLSLWWRDFEDDRDYRLTSGVGEYSEPSVSPDGLRLVGTVVEVRQSLERVPMAINRPVTLEPLTNGFSGDFDPSWSPDGSQLVFSSSRTGNRTLWSTRADLSQPAPLTTGLALDERPVYSPDGRQIAFVSDRGGRRGVWVMNVDGGAPRLVSAADVVDSISWSPDGRRLVYAAPGDAAPGLMIMTVADGRSVRLPTPAAASAPAWSSQNVIAYLEPRGGATGTFVRLITPDGGPVPGGAPDNPATVQFGNGFVAWSPDGLRLAAVSLPGASAGSIWVMTPDSPKPFRKLVDLPAGVFLRGITWSRDASSLIVGRIQWAGDIFLAERSR